MLRGGCACGARHEIDRRIILVPTWGAEPSFSGGGACVEWRPPRPRNDGTAGAGLSGATSGWPRFALQRRREEAVVQLQSHRAAGPVEELAYGWGEQVQRWLRLQREVSADLAGSRDERGYLNIEDLQRRREELAGQMEVLDRQWRELSEAWSALEHEWNRLGHQWQGQVVEWWKLAH